MTDLYLRAADEAAMDAALTEAGLLVEVTVTVETDGEKPHEETALAPAPGVSLDRIGPFSKVAGYDDKGEPILKHYPEYHCNVRAPGISDEALKLLEPLSIVPPDVPFRTWA